MAAFAALIASGLSLGTPEMLPRLFRAAIAAAVSPFPVMYASIIDAVPEGASSGLEVMIGVGLGASGFIAAPVAG